MPQTASVRASISVTKTASPDGGQARVEQALSFLADLANGTASGQADLSFVDTGRAIIDGGTEDFDLSGSLTDPFGATINAVKIVAIAIKNAGATTLTIGGATAEWLGFFGAVGDKIVLRAGEWFIAYSNTGWAVTAATADDLKIANAAGGGAGSFDIGFIARSA